MVVEGSGPVVKRRATDNSEVRNQRPEFRTQGAAGKSQKLKVKTAGWHRILPTTIYGMDRGDNHYFPMEGANHTLPPGLVSTRLLNEV